MLIEALSFKEEKKMFKKAISLLLSLMLVVTTLSVTIVSVSAADSVYFCRRHIEIAAAAARADGDAAQRDSVRHSAGAGLRNRERFAHLPVGGG